ncbi:MAG: radical SAM peptide maturase [Tannerellaceae bacterium]|nr:radical SAM peptide maturase [Tannerellaceae bacterium]
MFLLDTESKHTDYYRSKQEFLSAYGFYDKYDPPLIPEYDSQSLKANLANLRMLLLEMTDGCNLTCKYCGYRELYGNYDTRKNKSQTFENIKGLIDYLAVLWKSPLNVSYNNVLTIGFYGGEPLLSIELIKKTIEYIELLNITGLSFNYNMTTNAYLLDKCMDFLVEKKFHLLLSLDGNEINNSYRVNHRGEDTFTKVLENTKLLQQSYPDYFRENVRFNSVLHNNNSVEDIYLFFKKTFDKIPAIAELNTNGVAKDKKQEFFEMYKNKLQSTEEAKECEGLKDDKFGIDPDITNLSYMIDAFTTNTFESYTDLFVDASKQKYIPTGTCPPMKRKLFFDS